MLLLLCIICLFGLNNSFTLHNSNKNPYFFKGKIKMVNQELVDTANNLIYQGTIGTPWTFNDLLINFSIKEIKNKVPRAIIMPGNAYPIPAIVDKKLKPLKFWYLILKVIIKDNNIHQIVSFVGDCQFKTDMTSNVIQSDLGS